MTTDNRHIVDTIDLYQALEDAQGHFAEFQDQISQFEDEKQLTRMLPTLIKQHVADPYRRIRAALQQCEENARTLADQDYQYRDLPKQIHQQMLDADVFLKKQLPDAINSMFKGKCNPTYVQSLITNLCE